jgi:Cytochrome P450
VAHMSVCLSVCLELLVARMPVCLSVCLELLVARMSVCLWLMWLGARACAQGTRGCIGQRFALQELKVALIRLYQAYTFRLAPGQVPLETKTTLTTSPKHGVFVTVHPRQ